MNTNIQRDDDGTFPAYAWPGGYPIVYVLADGEILCAECASKADDAPVGGQIHWEGGPETCAHCGAEIESAYGVPGDA